jgi:hypothetical protein
MAARNLAIFIIHYDLCKTSAPLINAVVLGFGFLRRPISCIHAVVRESPVTL